MKRVIIAGCRHFDDYGLLLWFCEHHLKDYTGITIISGGAIGADRLGEQYARKFGHGLEVFKADWDKHGKSAGPIRNKEMAMNADSLIAFWDGHSKGTKNMIDTAKKMGLKVIVCNIKYHTQEKPKTYSN